MSSDLWQHIRQVGAYSILVTVFAVGLAIATIFWSASTVGLQTDLRRSQEELSRITRELTERTAEVGQVKTENARLRAEQQELGKKVSVVKVAGQPKAASVNKEAGCRGGSYEEMSLPEGETKTVGFGVIGRPIESILITLVRNSFEGDPPRYRVHAVLGALGQPSQKIEGQDVGYSTTYRGYDVRILKVDSGGARFLVTYCS